MQSPIVMVELQGVGESHLLGQFEDRLVRPLLLFCSMLLLDLCGVPGLILLLLQAMCCCQVPFHFVHLNLTMVSQHSKLQHTPPPPPSSLLSYVHDLAWCDCDVHGLG